MGRRGKKPQPTALRILAGNPGKVTISKLEPKPEPLDDLTAPPHLQKNAIPWWDYYVNILRGMGLTSVADRIALEQLAVATADRIEAEARLLESGPLFVSPNRFLMAHPNFAIVERLRKRELDLLREFGMTPSARSGVRRDAGDNHAENKFAQFVPNTSQ